MKKIINILFFITILITNAYADENFRNDRYRGWHWYEDPVIVKDEEEQKEQQTFTSAKEEAEAFIKKLDEAKYEAMLRPTHNNVEKYIRLQSHLTTMASNFSDTWQQVLILKPDLDYQAINPTANYASKAKNEIKDNEIFRKMSILKEHFTLVYIYMSSCPYCRDFSPVLKNFAETYKWDIGSISLDGGILPEFPDPSDGRNLDIKINVPAVMVYDNNNGSVYSLSVGAIAQNDLLAKISFLYDILENQRGNND